VPSNRTQGRKLRRHALLVPALGLFLIGCAPSSPSLFWGGHAFPPQRVIENRNYASFVAENQRQLEACGGFTKCDQALFNLGFVYAYPQSPYRDPEMARRYFSELQAKYPESPWTHQGRALVAFMNRTSELEATQRRLQADLRARDALIRQLREQLNRSREIDIEMQKKERELLR
jgi:hypothetical protein